MKSKFRCCFLFAFLCVSISPGHFQQTAASADNHSLSKLQVNSWTVPLSISNDNISFIRTFGGDPGGTANYDSHLDVVAPPPGMTFYSYFKLAQFPHFLANDIRGWNTPYDQNISWTLEIKNTAMSQTTISWDPARLPLEGSFALEGLTNAVDMRALNSIEFLNDQVLTIKYLALGEDTLQVVNSQGGVNALNQPVDLSLTNSFPVTSIIFNLHDTPDLLQFSNAQLTARSAGFELSATEFGNYVQLMLYHSSGGTISTGKGPIMTLFYNVSSAATAGTVIQLELKDVTVLDNDSIERQLSLQDGIFSVIGLKGDVNNDGSRNILDLLLIIAFINQQQVPTPEQQWAADCNDDGAINILDIIQLINWINGLLLEKVPPAEKSPVQLSLPTFPLQNHQQANLPIRLTTEQPVAGIQIKFSYSGSNELFPEPEIGILPAGVRYSIHSRGDERIILFYYLAGTGFAPGEHLLFEIPFQPGMSEADISFDDILIANPNGQAIPVQKLIQRDGSDAAPVKSFRLSPNFPNPFNPATHLSYQLPVASQVVIKIVNILGQEIKTLVNRHQAAGRFQLEWDGTDNLNQEMGSGVYFCVMQAGEFRKMQKMLLVR